MPLDTDADVLLPADLPEVEPPVGRVRRAALTDRRLDQLAVKRLTRPVDLSDITVQGLVARVQPSGARSFYFRWRGPGGFRRVRLDAATVAEARLRAVKAKAAVAIGRDPRVTKAVHSTDTALTVSAAVSAYVEEELLVRRNRDARYVENVRRLFANHVEPQIGALRLIDITHADLSKLFGGLMRQASAKGGGEVTGMAPNYRYRPKRAIDGRPRRVTVLANRVHSQVMGMLRWAEEDGRLPPGVVPRVRKPIRVEPSVRRLQQGTKRVLHLSHLAALWWAVEAEPAHVRVLIRLLLLLPLRRQEITLLEWREVKGLAGEISADPTTFLGPRLDIGAERMKGNRPHLVPLPPVAAGLLREMARSRGKAGPHVFSLTSGKTPFNGWQSLVDRLRRRCPDLPAGWTIHDFRTAIATASHGDKLLIVQPTKELVEQTALNLRAEAPDTKVTVITRHTTSTVVADVVRYFQNAVPGGEALLITHAAFMRLPFISGRQQWHLYLDEAPAGDWFAEYSVPDTHRVLSDAFAIEPVDAQYGRLSVVDKRRLDHIAKNKNNDQVYGLFSDLAYRALSEHWELSVPLSNWISLRKGLGDGEARRLRVHGLLKPSLVDGFHSVTILSAVFEESLLYRLWLERNVEFREDRLVTRHLRYTDHPNGSLLTVKYLTEEAWSQNFGAKPAANGITVLQMVAESALREFAGQRFVWQANKAVPDDFLAVEAGRLNLSKPDAERLPAVAHGLNRFMGLHNAAIVGALIPPPAHFAFLATKGVESEAVKTAVHRQAVYQAAARISLRNPDDPNEKTVLVPDRATADWLAALFPGSRVQQINSAVSRIAKGKPGRPRLHESSAARTRAYRERKRQEREVAVGLVNGRTEFGRLQPLAHEILATAPEFDGALTDLVAPANLVGTIYETIFDRKPFDHGHAESVDSFICALRDLHLRHLPKAEASLLTPAIMDPAKASETKRGLENVRGVWGLWLDNDGGDLTAAEFARLFPTFRMVIFNTYSSTVAKPRWRVFIPTNVVMTIDTHHLALTNVLKRLNREGYWSAAELEKRPNIKVRRVHGFDMSKLVASSMFYLPCQAAEEGASFFHDYAAPPRDVLDVWQIIERPLVPEPMPEPDQQPAAVPVATAGVGPVTVNGSMAAMQAALLRDRGQDTGARREEALTEWRMVGVQPGKGHAGFFRLANRLARTGMSAADLRTTLWQEAALANSPAERRKEIGPILQSLGKKGLI